MWDEIASAVEATVEAAAASLASQGSPKSWLTDRSAVRAGNLFSGVKIKNQEKDIGKICISEDQYA